MLTYRELLEKDLSKLSTKDLKKAGDNNFADIDIVDSKFIGLTKRRKDFVYYVVYQDSDTGLYGVQDFIVKNNKSKIEGGSLGVPEVTGLSLKDAKKALRKMNVNI